MKSFTLGLLILLLFGWSLIQFSAPYLDKPETPDLLVADLENAPLSQLSSEKLVSAAQVTLDRTFPPDVERANTLLRAALRKSPLDSVAWAQLARSGALANDTAAESSLNLAVQLDPGFLQQKVALLPIYLALGKQQEAYRLAEVVLANSPQRTAEAFRPFLSSGVDLTPLISILKLDALSDSELLELIALFRLEDQATRNNFFSQLGSTVAARPVEFKHPFVAEIFRQNAFPTALPLIQELYPLWSTQHGVLLVDPEALRTLPIERSKPVFGWQQMLVDSGMLYAFFPQFDDRKGVHRFEFSAAIPSGTNRVYRWKAFRIGVMELPTKQPELRLQLTSRNSDPSLLQVRWEARSITSSTPYTTQHTSSPASKSEWGNTFISVKPYPRSGEILEFDMVATIQGNPLSTFAHLFLDAIEVPMSPGDSIE
jgi:hypothetical protein